MSQVLNRLRLLGQPQVLFEIAMNFVLPWLVYREVAPLYGETPALIASAVPPLIQSALELVRHRRLDALSVLVLAGIAFSIAAMALGGSPAVLLMRESFITGLFGAAFLASSFLRRPALYYLARATMARKGARAVEGFEQTAAPQGRLAPWIRLMNTVWGTGLLAEALLRVALIQAWSPERVLLVAPWVSYGVMGALVLWTGWYGRVIRQRRDSAQTQMALD